MTEVPMIDWYSSLMCSRERQRDLIQQAVQRRRLEAARGAGGAGGSSGLSVASRVRRRIGEALISLGQMLL